MRIRISPEVRQQPTDNLSLLKELQSPPPARVHGRVQLSPVSTKRVPLGGDVEPGAKLDLSREMRQIGTSAVTGALG